MTQDIHPLRVNQTTTSLSLPALRRIAAAVAREMDVGLEVLGTVSHGSADHVEVVLGRRDSESAISVVITVRRQSSEANLRDQLAEGLLQHLRATG